MSPMRTADSTSGKSTIPEGSWAFGERDFAIFVFHPLKHHKNRWVTIPQGGFWRFFWVFFFSCGGIVLGINQNLGQVFSVCGFKVVFCRWSLRYDMP